MPDTYGHARTATEDELSDELEGEGGGDLYLGRYYDAASGEAGGEIRYGGDRHLLVFGPTGSGKGRRLLMPNLLTGLKEQSVVVIDPKGEAADFTANARRAMGQDVVILNPFNVRGLGSAGFNPLAALNPDSPTFYDDANGIGEALIKIQGSDPHWTESALGLIVALVMWEKRKNGPNANLGNVRTMLTEAKLKEAAEGSDGERYMRQTAGLRVTAANMLAEGGPEIESLIARFIESTREIDSIQSTADTQTRWLLSPPVRGDLERDGLDFAKLRDRPTTVYVVLPAERLRTHSVWLRLVIVSALTTLYRKKEGRRVVMLVDEMAALGHLAPLEDAFALIRGFNIQIAAMFQDLGQLKELYKERWETFIANAGPVFGFAPNDLTTADWMSRRSGQTTIVLKGYSENSSTTLGNQMSISTSEGISEQQFGRNLFLSHELIGLERGMGLLWLAGLGNTTRIFAPDFEKIAACKERFKPLTGTP